MGILGDLTSNLSFLQTRCSEFFPIYFNKELFLLTGFFFSRSLCDFDGGRVSIASLSVNKHMRISSVSIKRCIIFRSEVNIEQLCDNHYVL